MAYSTTSSLKPKTNTNAEISTSTFDSSTQGSPIKNITLSQIQTAINKLSTYISKVDNCGNCYNVTLCQTTNTTTKTNATSTKTNATSTITYATSIKTTTSVKNDCNCYYNHSNYYDQCGD